ncbi:hypothetical protein RvY_12204 [Ramazzottius varieornatus]|uniref:Uncharacterized protein n=1 Tax=Ramazzottius varieornatus TaxID=947166 RepID=A0A1D1VIS4_RAMVA|nr:hypothetical protein RvY_12204 [Ramazzottius varieornatus]
MCTTNIEKMKNFDCWSHSDSARAMLTERRHGRSITVTTWRMPSNGTRTHPYRRTAENVSIEAVPKAT